MDNAVRALEVGMIRAAACLHGQAVEHTAKDQAAARLVRDMIILAKVECLCATTLDERCCGMMKSSDLAYALSLLGTLRKYLYPPNLGQI